MPCIAIGTKTTTDSAGSLERTAETAAANHRNTANLSGAKGRDDLVFHHSHPWPRSLLTNQQNRIGVFRHAQPSVRIVFLEAPHLTARG